MINNNDYCPEKNYITQLEASTRIAATNLVNYYDELRIIVNYSELLNLNADLLKLLITFEEYLVDCIDCVDCVNGKTSGHHRDKLDVYYQAINGECFKGNYVYFCDDGGLNYNIAQHLSVYTTLAEQEQC